MAALIDDLFPEVCNPPNIQVINDRCLLRTQDGHRVVIVSGVVLAQYGLEDRMAEAHAMVSLVEQGWADQNDVACAFGCSVRTLRRDQRRYEDGGLAALGQSRGYPSGRARLTAPRRQTVHRLKTQGHSNCEIARRLGISETAVRKLLLRIGWKERVAEPVLLPLEAIQSSNPKLSAFSSGAQDSPVISHDTDPSDRGADRLLARLGLLDDAPPLFGSAPAVPRAGVLLALACPGRQRCLRVRTENLRQPWPGLLWIAHQSAHAPAHGAVAHQTPGGSQGVFSCRIWDACWDWTEHPKSKRCGANWPGWRRRDAPPSLARPWPSNGSSRVAEALGFLYIDGHVRVYHGQQVLPKAHVARMRISLPATSDYWVNDSAGDPLFVVTAEANAGLVKMLPECSNKSAVWSASGGSPWSLIAAGSVPNFSSRS